MRTRRPPQQTANGPPDPERLYTVERLRTRCLWAYQVEALQLEEREPGDAAQSTAPNPRGQ
jgi:hypothetical protein